MSRFLYSHHLFLKLSVSVPDNVNLPGQKNVGGFLRLLNGNDVIYKLLGRVNDQLWFLAGLLCLIVFLRGGYQLITARGDDAAMKGAKNKMIGAGVGMLLVLLSYAVVRIVVNFL